jgi:hypothetical protein
MIWLRRYARYINFGVLGSWFITLAQQSWNRGWITWVDLLFLLALFAWACLGVAPEKRHDQTK